MANEELRAGITLSPFWWKAGPRPKIETGELPQKVDILIIGSGFTGLSAALTLARAGREVLIVERESAGWGASSRNQGHVGAGLKRGLSALSQTFGKPQAVRVFREAQAAVEFCKTLIEKEGINCRLEKRGRVQLAWSPAHYEMLAEEIRQRVALTSLEADLLTREEVQSQVVSDQYYGGVLMHREATLHGALFHLGLLKRVEQGGVTVQVDTEVRRIEGATPAFTVVTSRGKVNARNVVVATNGYTDRSTLALCRRVVPLR
mgnify:CR=1 FL=1